MTTMRERFWNKIERCEFTFDDTGVEKMIDFIEQELKKEREEIVEIAWDYMVKAFREESFNKEEFINIIKNRV